MKRILILILMVGAVTSWSQNSRPDCPGKDDAELGYKVYSGPDSMPSYPGGEMACAIFIMENIDTSLPLVSGQMYVEVTVDSEGKIVRKSMMSEGDKTTQDAVMATIDKMPNWTPAVCQGRKVAAKYMFPVIIN